MDTAAADDNAPDTGQRSPMVSRMLVGAALRRLRETAGLSREEAGRAIDAPASAISQMELGRIGCRLRDVIDLCTLYGVTDQVERATLLGLVRQASRPEWWRAYRDVIPGWFVHYLGLEQSASLIRSYELQLIPGLLQTADYARAVIELGHGGAPEQEIERRVELRLRRQDVLRSARAPRLWAVIDEAALRLADRGHGNDARTAASSDPCLRHAGRDDLCAAIPSRRSRRDRGGDHHAAPAGAAGPRGRVPRATRVRCVLRRAR